MPVRIQVFLSNGCTKAFFHSSANRPVFSDKLIIFVMTGSRWSRCTDSIDDGSGSRSHDFLQATAKLFTSSSVSSANSEKERSVQEGKVSLRRRGSPDFVFLYAVSLLFPPLLTQYLFSARAIQPDLHVIRSCSQ